MNFKSISYYLGLFCFPVSILAFINILYSSYFDYFLSINSYVITLIVSFITGLTLVFVGKNSEKKPPVPEEVLEKFKGKEKYINEFLTLCKD